MSDEPKPWEVPISYTDGAGPTAGSSASGRGDDGDDDTPRQKYVNDVPYDPEDRPPMEGTKADPSKRTAGDDPPPRDGDPDEEYDLDGDDINDELYLEDDESGA